MKCKLNDYQIGEVSKFYGISIDTIRIYDKKSILTPIKKGSGNYRTFTKEDFITMDYVIRMRKLQLSLEDIRHMLNEDSLQDVKTSIMNHKEKIRTHIKELQEIERQVNDYENKLNEAISILDKKNFIKIVQSPTFIVKEINTTMQEVMEAFNTLHSNEMPFLTVTINDENSGIYSPNLLLDRESRQSITEYSVTLADYGNISEKEDFPKEIFDIIPPTLCLYTVTCLYTNQDYSSSQYIRQYLEENNLEIAGKALYRLLAFTHNITSSNEYLEVWLPIKIKKS